MSRNELESFFLAALSYNVNVKSSIYTQIYFKLRECVPFISLTWALSPLEKKDEEKIMVDKFIFTLSLRKYASK